MMEDELIRKHLFNKVLLTFLTFFWMVYTPVFAVDMGLVDLLSSQLGVSKDQANGGAGAIFQLAKQNLSIEDFSTIAKTVPDVNQMIGAAPKAEKNSGALGSISSLMGGNSNKLQGMAGLASPFKQLGMSGDMVSKFVPIILDYVQNKGGDQAMNLLKGALL